LKRWKYLDQLLLIPITMWTTIEAAFFTAQFTQVSQVKLIDLISCLLEIIVTVVLSIGFHYLFDWHSVTIHSIRIRQQQDARVDVKLVYFSFLVMLALLSSVMGFFKH
jgi:hypothetical protein